MRLMRLILVTLAFLLTVSAFADRIIPPRFPQYGAHLRTEAQVERLPVIDRSGGRELAHFKLEPVVLRDLSGVMLAGEVRHITPIRVDVPTTSGVPAMLGRITLEGARAARLRFADVEAGMVLWLAGSDDEQFIRFEPSESAQWGPTTRGTDIFIAAEGSAGSVSITDLAQIAVETSTQNSCLTDVACVRDEFPSLPDASRAIGYVHYVSGGKAYSCSGGLVNDALGSGTPYFLTARHCINTPEEAASVEVVWDLRSEACGSNRMVDVRRSYGAELLVSSEATDVALLKLRSVPEDRVFLGIDTTPLAQGTIVDRVSHAGGLSQTYSSGRIETTGLSCGAAPRPQFLYTRLRSGGISGGSSGAPLLVNGLYAVGQLRGVCGSDPSNACVLFNQGVDGALRESWPLLAKYLDPITAVTRRRSVR